MCTSLQDIVDEYSCTSFSSFKCYIPNLSQSSVVVFLISCNSFH
nr:MAG TPA: hypothetical protein [Caudoviricetes sp.]DAS28772.1 MAG TPA: hypothetical protein [Caudoviricetes sp.]